jgi:hypothetical protein
MKDMCPCGCELEVRREKAVVLRCPKCDIVVIAPDMDRAKRMLKARLDIRENTKGRRHGDEGNGKGGSAAARGEKA